MKETAEKVCQAVNHAPVEVHGGGYVTCNDNVPFGSPHQIHGEAPQSLDELVANIPHNSHRDEYLQNLIHAVAHHASWEASRAVRLPERAAGLR
jgi:hypothetical protein